MGADAFRGRVQVYTGEGKGKTTAALGLALRAAGRGLATYIGQFMKGPPAGEAYGRGERPSLRPEGRPAGEAGAQARDATPTGELEAPRLTGGLVEIEQYGSAERFARKEAPAAADAARARAGLQRARAAMRSGRYRIVVLDEACTAVEFRLLAADDLLALVNERPADVELVLTGRGAPEALLEAADLVTEMREVKHYYREGLAARDGIER